MKETKAERNLKTKENASVKNDRKTYIRKRQTQSGITLE